ncbi:MAG: metallophosphoesterase family protein [Planctomycetota bacterium]
MLLAASMARAQVDAELRELVEDHEPAAVYLTWSGDPTTSVNVQWLGRNDDDELDLSWRPEGGEAWRAATPVTRRPMPGDGRSLGSVRLSGLRPDTSYEFSFVGSEHVRHFRTLSRDPVRPLRFAVGGDIEENMELVAVTNRRVAATAPDFVLWGGDLAYANGDLANARKWVALLETYSRTMERPDGTLIPLVAAIGNHEVANGGRDRPRSDAPFFYSLLDFPGPRGYGVLDLGPSTSLVVLDSGHTNAIDGEQARWLDETLAARKGRTHLMAAYHVPAYPSKRSYWGRLSRAIRKHWVPLFERHGVDLVFEHHDHAYKRTQPIRNGEIDGRGVVYLGDGGWGGRRARVPAPPGRGGFFSNRRWYLARSESRSYHALVELDGRRRAVRAFDHDGLIIDDYVQFVGRPAPIEAVGGDRLAARPEVWVLAAALLLPLLVWLRRHWRRRRGSGRRPVVAAGVPADRRGAPV